MELYIERTNEKINIVLDKPKILKEILKEHNINLESVILVKNDKIVLEDIQVNNNDKVKIISVVSGG